MKFFIAIAVTHFLALLSPGPDFFLLFTTLLRYSRQAAYQVAWGITLGNALILLGLMLALSQLGQLNAQVFMGLRYVGAAYLLYLAYLCIRYANQPLELTSSPNSKSQDISGYYLLGLGLQSSLLNPKNWMFYTSLMVLLAEQRYLLSTLGLCVWMVAVVTIWNRGLVELLTHPRYLKKLQQYTRHIHYISGICFLVFSGILFAM